MEAGSAVEKNDVECSGLGYKQATVAHCHCPQPRREGISKFYGKTFILVHEIFLRVEDEFGIAIDLWESLDS